MLGTLSYQRLETMFAFNNRNMTGTAKALQKTTHCFKRLYLVIHENFPLKKCCVENALTHLVTIYKLCRCVSLQSDIKSFPLESRSEINVKNDS